ncbi:MAG: dihydroorotase [Myxococcota bacterium]
MNRLVLRRPDDWHLHLRDGAGLAAVLPPTADVFGRALVMPNLVPPVTTVDAALAYRDRIRAALPAGSRFRPLMALYLTEATSPETLEAAAAHPDIAAVKLYPAGATTNSDAGVRDPSVLGELYAVMERTGLVLCVHGEVTDPHVDIFDREAVFLETVLAPILERHPGLRVVVEHATTAQAVQFVRSAGDTVAASLTAHHLLMSRNALFEGGIRPHRYCLPILKREEHRIALLEAAISGSPKFFLGTDSAPHARHRKEAACGCAGMYTSPVAMGLYAEAFENAGEIQRLEHFASLAGPAFYGLPPNDDTITLVRQEQVVPETLPFGDDVIVPIRAGGVVRWRVEPARS